MDASILADSISQHGAVLVSTGRGRDSLNCRLRRLTLTDAIDELVNDGIVLLPSPRPDPSCVGGASPRILTPEEVKAFPALRRAAQRRDMRIVAVVWSDGTAVVTLVPNHISDPPQWWCRRAYDEACAAAAARG